MNINDFLKEIEFYAGDYSKKHEISSGKEILRICENYYLSCSNEYIFYYYKAIAYIFLKEFDKAKKELKNAIDIEKEDERIFLLRAKCFESENKWESALGDYITAYELNDKCVEAIFKIGYYFVEDGEYEEALVYFNKAYLLKEDHKINFALAGVYYGLGQFEKALNHINKAIEFNGNIANYYMSRGVTNRILDNLDSAIKDYEQAIELEDNNPQPQYYLANLYLDMGEVWKSTLILKNLIERYPKYIDAYSTLSMCYIEMGNLEEAINMIDKALDIDENNIGFRYIKADILYSQEKFDLVKQEYFNLIEKGEDTAFCFNSLARLYMDSENYDKGIYIINKGLEKEPDDLYLNRNLAYCYFYKEQYEEAIDSFNMAISLAKVFDEEIALDYSSRGRCYYLLNKDEEAEKDYLKALELDKNDETVYFYLGYIYYYNSDYEKCIEIFSHYIDMMPDEFEVVQAIAECYMKLNNFKEACRLLEYTLNGIDLFEDKAQIYTQLGVCYGRLENTLKALEYYDKALEENNNYLLAHYNKGLSYSKNKEYKKAIKAYDIALELDKENHYVYYNRGVAYENLEKYDLAEFDYKRALKINNEPALYEEIAWVCFLQDKHKEAIYNYEMAIDNGIKEAYTYGNLARVYKALKNYTVAIKYFEFALKLEKDLNKSWCINAIKNLAFCYMEVEKYENAIKWCCTVIEGKKKNSDIYAIRGVCYMALMENEKALEDIKEALDLGDLESFKIEELKKFLIKLKNENYSLV